jgi:hypothetical protein
MSYDIKRSTLNTAKTILIAGYAVSLFLPYRVEKHNGETTYHAPLYKLSYKSTEIPEETCETSEQNGTEPKTQTVHTYTITSFGLLNDQIDTAKRLYKAALLKKPYIQSKAKDAVHCVSDKAKSTLSSAKSKAKNTASAVSVKAKLVAADAKAKAQSSFASAQTAAKGALSDISEKAKVAVKDAKAAAVKTAGSIKAIVKPQPIPEESVEE